jgi:hypothetical protein
MTVWPRQLRTNGTHVSYTLQDDYYAVHHRRRGAAADDAVLVLNEGEIAVFRGRPPAGLGVGPVYATPEGSLAVPTGLVFVRFAEGTSVAARRGDLERLGFELVEVPSYARHAAWVRARGEEGIGSALGQAADLATLPGVEHVEPQMLMAVSRR